MELGQSGTRTVLSLRVCVLRSDGTTLCQRSRLRGFRELSVEFLELFSREKEQPPAPQRHPRLESPARILRGFSFGAQRPRSTRAGPYNAEKFSPTSSELRGEKTP